MALLQRLGIVVLVWALACISLSDMALPGKTHFAFATAIQVARTPRDGQHDFDFEIGTWKSHISRRLHPLTGSNTWIQMEATVVFRKVWNGHANLMELQADGPNGHLEELNLRLYNPQSHQWTFNFANRSDGTMSKPMVGEFRDGRGEFVGQDSLNGRIILVRHVFSDITPDSHHFEQSFSDDGGKTWEPNFVATLTRVKEEGSAATN